MRKTRKGFTIVELLVTIGVMAVLSAGVVATIGQGPRRSARDGQRKADLEKVRSALEMYRNDVGSYPAETYGNAAFVGNGKYISVMPTNPTGGNYTYTRTTNLTYSFCATLERPVGDYCVYNP